MGGGMANGEPDYSAYTYDPAARAAATDALKPYGLSPLSPDQVNPNALLPNTGFFGRHPNLSSRLEGAIFGGAATQGSNTWGEGISNVFSGLINGQQNRRSMINRQFEAPFQQARGLESLYDLQQKRKDQDAMIDYHKAMVGVAQNKPAPPIQGISKTDSAYREYNQDTGKWELKENPYYDPNEARKAGQTEIERMYEGIKGPPPKPGTPSKTKGKDTSQEYYEGMAKFYRTQSASKAYGNAAAQDQAHFDSGAKEDPQDKSNREYQGKMQSFIKSQNKRSFWASQTPPINIGDEPAKQAWYKKNYPKGGSSPNEYNYDPAKGLVPAN